MSLTIFPLKGDKTPAVSGWQQYKGEANTPMVGIKIPDGVVVLDLDTYKGVTRESVERVLGCSLDWDDAILQQTMNGGEHYAFRCSGEVRQGSDLLGIAGFDTRASGKGYIATGNGYTNLSLFGVVETLSEPETLPEFPANALPKLSGSVVVKVGAGDCDDLLTMVEAEPLEFTWPEAVAFVRMLPLSACREQDTWLRVGMAIHHQSGGSEEGWRLFDEFSARDAEKYDQTKNRRRWESFENVRTNSIKFGYVVELAGGREARTKVQTQAVRVTLEDAETVGQVNAELKRMANMKLDNLTLEAMLKSVQTKFKALQGDAPTIPTIRKELKRLRGDANTGDYVDDYVFMTATGEYLCRETKAVMGPRAFDVKHNRDTPLNGDGDRQTATAWANDRIDVVENMMYFPKADEVFSHAGLDYINAYVPCSIKRVAVGTTDIVERIKGHIAHLLPDTSEQELVINYLAHNVQHPGEKIQWAMVLQGVQGDGKSLLAEMMQHVLGYQNVRIMNVQTLESAFTGWATGQCMTFIEELKLDNKRKYEVLNNLKPYISNPTVEETKKGKDPRTVINTTNYFALTNFQDAIPIDENDRRYAILFSQWQSKEKLQAFMAENPDYYPALYEAMRDGAGEILEWLLTHPIPASFKAMKRAPDTRAKESMKELSKSGVTLALEDAIDRFENKIMEGDEMDVTTLGKLVKDAQVFGDFEDFPKTAALKNALMSMGWSLSGRRRPKNGGENKHYFYTKL